MALAQQYTWARFLKEHPDLKEKGIKRTSAEGKKAFEAAYKKFAKAALKDREEWVKREESRVEALKTAVVGKLKALDGKKWHLKAKVLNQKAGRHDAYLAKLSKLKTSVKELSKKI